MQNTIAKDTLCEYVRQNEVVFQTYGDIIEVANEALIAEKIRGEHKRLKNRAFLIAEKIRQVGLIDRLGLWLQ